MLGVVFSAEAYAPGNQTELCCLVHSGARMNVHEVDGELRKALPNK